LARQRNTASVAPHHQRGWWLQSGKWVDSVLADFEHLGTIGFELFHAQAADALQITQAV